MTVFKWGDEQIANTTTIGDQDQPTVAVLSNGRYVVAWRGPGSSGTAVFAQLYDTLGNKLGGEVNLTNGLFASSFVGSDPHLAARGTGFVLSLVQNDTSAGAIDHVYEIYFDGDGALVGTSLYTGGPVSQIQPAVAATFADSALAWHETGNGGDVYFYRGGLIGPGGFNPAFAVGGLQERPDVAQLAGGNFVVTWFDDTEDRVEFRVFQPDGTTPVGASGSADLVAGAATNASPKVIPLSNGAFVIAWDAAENPLYPDLAGSAIHARIFDATGTGVGSEFILNETTAGTQNEPDLTPLSGGRFMAVWTDNDTATIRGQVWSARGTPVGAEFIVNSDSAVSQLAEVSTLPDGRVVVVWTSALGDGSGKSIHSQILDPREGLVNGTAGAETLYGHTVFADEISGFGGNDVLLGMGGDDQIYGGSGADTLNGGAGADRLSGGAQRDKYIPGVDRNDDVLVFATVSDSTGVTRDILEKADFYNDEDRIDLPVIPVAIAPAIMTGTLSSATFNADLAAAVNASTLPVGRAVLFDPSAGNLNQAGMAYLIVDANGVAGYQANQDWVFQLENCVYLTFDLNDFV